MKKLSNLLVLIALLFALAFVVTPAHAAPIGQDANPPTIEQFDYIAQLIIGVVTLLVVFGLKYGAKEWGIDLTGKATQVTATIVGLIFETINTLLVKVPPEFYPVVVAFFGLLTSILVAFGVAGLLKKYMPAPGAKQLPK